LRGQRESKGEKLGLVQRGAVDHEKEGGPGNKTSEVKIRFHGKGGLALQNLTRPGEKANGVRLDEKWGKVKGGIQKRE